MPSEASRIPNKWEHVIVLVLNVIFISNLVYFGKLIKVFVSIITYYKIPLSSSLPVNNTRTA